MEVASIGGQRFQKVIFPKMSFRFGIYCDNGRAAPRTVKGNLLYMYYFLSSMFDWLIGW